MPIYIYPKVCDYDCGNFGIGGPGLGNMLFPWARSIVFAKQYENPIFLTPAWKQIKPSRILKRNSDQRNYDGFFKKNNFEISGVCKLKILLTKKILDEKAESQVNNKLENTVIRFKGMNGHFKDILSEYKFVKTKLLEMSNDEYKSALEFDFRNSISIHIRLGDFKIDNSHTLAAVGQTNTRIPLQWYIDLIEKFRAIAKEIIPIYIFSDGSDDELKSILDIKNVQRISFGSALGDLIGLSVSNLLVASGSTFSMWASYLGRMPVIWYKGQHKQKLYTDSNILEIEYDRDTDDAILANVWLQSLKKE